MTRVSGKVGGKIRGEPPNAHVRYEGFDAIDNGRCLIFRVKLSGQAAFEVTCDVSDAVFMGTSRVTIQDAAPMAYEKLVELFAKEHSIAPKTLCLTGTDIADYIRRHYSRKEAQFTRDMPH